jgi:hypothetical protein
VDVIDQINEELGSVKKPPAGLILCLPPRNDRVPSRSVGYRSAE